MLENLTETVQKTLLDLVTPDVQELKVLVTALQKQLDQRFDAHGQRADAHYQESDAQFKALMAALGQFKAQSELTNLRVITALSERVAVLEAHKQ
jgi:hypothetical protein